MNRCDKEVCGKACCREAGHPGRCMPAGHVLCPVCGGTGNATRHVRDWDFFTGRHVERAIPNQTCRHCGGRGYYYEEEKKKWTSRDYKPRWRGW